MCRMRGGRTQRRPRFAKAIVFGPERHVPQDIPLWVEPFFRCASHLNQENRKPRFHLQFCKLRPFLSSVSSPVLLL